MKTSTASLFTLGLSLLVAACGTSTSEPNNQNASNAINGTCEDACNTDADCDSDEVCGNGACEDAEVDVCDSDADCDSDEYCGKNGLNRNVCEPQRDADSECSSDKQCEKGLSCLGKPLGRCEPESTQALGEFCVNDKHCVSGSCTREYGCQCNDAADCGSGRYCDTGTLSLGHNTCQSYKPNGDTCSNDKQCAPPATCGGAPPMRCIVESSIGVGKACRKNAECTSGQCEKDVCVCSEDRHCDKGQSCKKPIGGANYCTDDLKRGAVCKHDAQCASNKCIRTRCD